MVASSDENVTPLVTAALVCWNHVRFVREAVLSAVHQTHTRMQLIVFDNGSTDGSRSELQELQAEHGFRLVFQENIGLVRTLNRAVNMAEGKYLATLATDDVWLPEKIAVQAAWMEQHPDVDLLATQYRCIDEFGKPLDLPTALRFGDTSFRELMSLGNEHILGPTLMYRMSALREFGGFDESIRIEDYGFALKLTHAGRRVVGIPDLLTLYRRHGSNWSSAFTNEMHEVGAAYRHTPEYKEYFKRHFPLSFWRLVKDGHKLKALRLLLDEPVPWTWSNVGRGTIRLLIPYSLIRGYRRLVGKPPEGEPSN